MPLTHVEPAAENLPATHRHRRDHDLARAAVAGDRMASEQIAEEQYVPVTRYLRSIGATPEQAEEVAQDVFVPTHLRNFRGESGLFTWFCAIGRRMLHRMRTRPGTPSARVGEGAASLDALREAGALEPADRTPGPLQALALDELAARVYRLLDDREALILNLRIHGGHGFHEIAGMTGMNANTVKSLYRRAVLRLQTRINLFGDDEAGSTNATETTDGGSHADAR
ncbi:MAG: RNA polymerase sigma factor [Planctomycetota bacterium]